MNPVSSVCSSSSTTTIENKIAINYGPGTLGISPSSIRISNDVQRGSISRRTLQVTTSAPAPTALRNISQTSSSLSNGRTSGTSISICSSSAQSNSLRASNVMNSTPLSSSTYLNPNFVRGTFRSVNAGSRCEYGKHLQASPIARAQVSNASSNPGRFSINGPSRPDAFTVPTNSGNPVPLSSANGGFYITSSISSPSLNSESDEEETAQPKPNHAHLLHSPANNVNGQSERPRPCCPPNQTKRDHLTIHFNSSTGYSPAVRPTDASPLRRSRTLMLNSNGKPEVNRGAVNRTEQDANSGLSSPVSTVSTKSVWFEYGCV